MAAFYRASSPREAPARASDLLRRKPQRVTATLRWHLVQKLQQRAGFEGRSLSNLIAHLLEAAKASMRLHGRRYAALIALVATTAKMARSQHM
jgi:hypothetical protein